MSERTVQIVGQRGGEPAATEPGAQPGAALDPRAAAWVEYLDAARQLDAVRRGAATAAGEQAQSAQSARELLTEVRARLAPQHSHLRELDVPAMTLSPTPPEVTAAGRRMTAGPEAVAGACARRRSWPTRPMECWPAGTGCRCAACCCDGPLAALVPLLQVLLYVSTGAGAWTVVSLLAGLPLAAALVAAVGVATHRIAGGREGRARRGGSLGLTLALAGTLLSTTIIGVTLMIG